VSPRRPTGRQLRLWPSRQVPQPSVRCAAFGTGADLPGTRPEAAVGPACRTTTFSRQTCSPSSLQASTAAPRTGACFMELASLLAGERWSDHPACTHPLLAAVARHVNDHTSDAGRQRLAELIPSVIGLTGDDLHIDARIALGSATVALPVVVAERQRVMAVSVLACERVLPGPPPATTSGTPRCVSAVVVEAAVDRMTPHSWVNHLEAAGYQFGGAALGRPPAGVAGGPPRWALPAPQGPVRPPRRTRRQVHPDRGGPGHLHASLERPWPCSTDGSPTTSRPPECHCVRRRAQARCRRRRTGPG
jgi:hypothetical protein